MHYGVDISGNNRHPIDWAAAFADLHTRGSGTQPFAIIKATQGASYINPCFAEDAAAAQAAGFALGAYLMDQGNTDPATEETAFRRVAGPLPQFDDDELPAGNTAYAHHCAQLVAQNPAAVDYLNQTEEDAGFPAGAGIWEANYNRQPGVTHRPALIHQYDDNGTVAGITGPVDLNAFLGTEHQFAATFANAHTAPPAHKGVDDMIATEIVTIGDNQWMHVFHDKGDGTPPHHYWQQLTGSDASWHLETLPAD